MAARKCTDGWSRAGVAALLALAAAGAGAYEDGAPPGHTGGFGEPDCSACHSGYAKNAPDGKLAIEGLPESYAPGESYRLAVELLHPELASGGLQLAVRTAKGNPAGELVAASDRLQLIEDAGQRYLQHTRAGTKTDTDGRIRWEFEWRAPEEPGPLVLNVAANAANDDLSALGDYIYTLEEKLDAAQESTTGSSRKR